MEFILELLLNKTVIKNGRFKLHINHAYLGLNRPLLDDHIIKNMFGPRVKIQSPKL